MTDQREREHAVERDATRDDSEVRREIIAVLLGKRTWSSDDLREMRTVANVAARLAPFWRKEAPHA